MVDDYADTRAILIDVLVSHGFRVETAEDGIEALDKARTWSPDVTLLDLSMPGLDGFAVARHLKTETATRDLPIVAYTAYSDPEYRSRAEEAGFAALLVKPAPPQEIVAKLRDLLPEAAGPAAPGSEADAEDTWTRFTEGRQAFESALPLRAQRLARAWQELRAAREPVRVRLDALILELQRLKGSASTYGLPEVARCAAKLERALAVWRAEPAAGTRDGVDRRMEDLRQAAARWGGRSRPGAAPPAPAAGRPKVP